MQIVQERTIVPRPIQRPTDIEKRPSDYGIEAPPPPAPKPESTIIKPAVSLEPETAQDPAIKSTNGNQQTPEPESAPEKDDWDFDLQ